MAAPSDGLANWRPRHSLWAMQDSTKRGRVTALVLAAGSASRFGAAKQVARVHEQPMVLHAVRACAHDTVAETLVLVGAHATAVKAALADEQVRFVEVPDWQDGIGRTISTGAQQVPAGNAVLVLLADTPGVGPAVVDRVLSALDEESDAARATFAGVPGHPVVMAPRLVSELIALRGDRGAAAMLKGRRVRLVECGDIGNGDDVDLPGDLPIDS